MNRRTRVKICGITNPDDAAFAAAHGADYIGVIFAESPRRVTAARAREIRDTVPDASLVGVFVDETVERVANTAEACGLDFIQLHGHESPDYCDELHQRSGVPIIKTFRAGEIPDAETLGHYHTTSYFLFDLDKGVDDPDELARLTERLWQSASKRRREGFRVLIAGALTAGNVRAAVDTTRAFCVDVCRGVEKSPGVKDHDAIVRFVSEVRHGEVKQ
jgi:phosphoribosylanthranilate isomerase